MNLILYDDFMNLLPSKIKDVTITNVFKKKKISKLFRILRKIHISSIIPFKKIWFGKWTNDIKNKEISLIIVFGCGNGKNIIKMIRSIDKNIRVIYWYWGPVTLGLNPSKLSKYDCEIWTFDPRDSVKYELLLNSQFYCFENINRNESDNFESWYDTIFVGSEKDRLDYLLELEKKLKSYDLKTYFHIVKSNKHYESRFDYKYCEQISYDEYLKYIIHSKCIVDIIASDQCGMTLRPLEALFFRKKLITNDLGLLKTNLNKKNIFVIGHDSFENIFEFVNSDYDDDNYNELVNYYSIQEWVKRFGGS